MNEEVKVIYHGANISEVDDYLTSNWNQTQIVAIFCTSQYAFSAPAVLTHVCLIDLRSMSTSVTRMCHFQSAALTLHRTPLSNLAK